MKRINLIIAIVAGVFCLTSQAFAFTAFTDRAAWISAASPYSDVTIPYTPYTDLTSLALPGGETMSFSQSVEVRQVPGSWSTWSGGNQPTVLFTNDYTTLTINLNNPIYSFGLEMEPDYWNDYSMSLTVPSQTPITQIVNGNGGAKFFGFTSDTGISSFTLSIDNSPSGFAFGLMVEGSNSNPVPEPATMSLFGLGLAGLLLKRKK